MGRETCIPRVVEDVSCAPIDKRVDFDSLTLGVEQWRRVSGWTLKVLTTTYPGIVALKRTRKRGDLANGAAAIRVFTKQQFIWIVR